MGFGLCRRGWGRFWRRPGRGIGFGGIATLFGPNALLGAFHCTALWWAMLAMRWVQDERRGFFTLVAFGCIWLLFSGC